MFASRLRRPGVEGVTVELRKHADALPDDLAAVVVDLTVEGAVQAVAAWHERTGRPVCGFAPHVEIERITSAKSAGVSLVWPRSRVVERLAAWLEENVAGR